MKSEVSELLKLSDDEQVDFVMSKNNVSFQFAVAGSCTDYDFFERMPDSIRRQEVVNAIVQMPTDIKEELYNHYFQGIYD